MKKNVYTIGRDESCDIVICDDSNHASRFHATLIEVKPGKYVITDQSTNGTYVNGIRITQGVEVPVTREDSISFANIVELEWSIIPDSKKKNTRIILITLLCSLLCVGLGFSAYYFYFAKTDDSTPPVVDQSKDTVTTQKKDTIKVEEIKPKAPVKKSNPEPKVETPKPDKSSAPAVVDPIF